MPTSALNVPTSIHAMAARGDLDKTLHGGSDRGIALLPEELLVLAFSHLDALDVIAARKVRFFDIPV